MQVGDVVRNKNAHPSFNSSRGVFLGWRTYVRKGARVWKVGGAKEEEFYVCALVAWFGGRVSTIQRDLIEVVDNVE